MQSSPLEIVQTQKFTVWQAKVETATVEPLEPVACPFTDLTRFIATGELEDLGIYLARKNLFAGSLTEFAAAGRRHADSIELQSRSGYGNDAMWPEAYGFFECRANRGSAEFWRHNDNATWLPGLVTFVDRLPFFRSTGKITIVLSQIGDRGAEHVDHKFDNLVSEFVWLRTGVGPRKDFFVRDADGNKRYVEEKESEGEGACLWFDDHHTHSIDPIVEPCYSIRIDGVFTDEFRNHICRVGTFCAQSPDGATLGGLCGVLLAQGAGAPLSLPASQSRKAAIDKARAACATIGSAVEIHTPRRPVCTI